MSKIKKRKVAARHPRPVMIDDMPLSIYDKFNPLPHCLVTAYRRIRQKHIAKTWKRIPYRGTARSQGMSGYLYIKPTKKR
jgi:hypothetical protein